MFFLTWSGNASYTTNIRLLSQQPLHRSVFMRTCCYTERFMHREVFIQTPLHRRFHTHIFLHRETFAQNSFYTKKSSSKGKQVYIWICFFCFLPFPFQPNGLRNANGWHSDIHAFLFVHPFSALYKWHDMTPMLDPLLEADTFTHSSLYTEQLLSARDLAQSRVCTADTFSHRGFYAKRL